jgi:hypothetical protein
LRLFLTYEPSILRGKELGRKKKEPLCCENARAQESGYAVGQKDMPDSYRSLELLLLRKFRCYIRCFMGRWKGYSDTNRKTNYITRLKTARRIY